MIVQSLTHFKLRNKIYFMGLFLLIILGKSYSQNEVKRWLVGNGVGFNFLTNPLSMFTASTVSQSWNFLEGNSTISDASGNPLFSTNGRHIWNQNQTFMANGMNITPNSNASSSQSALIVKQPLSNTIYYVFSLAEIANPPVIDVLRYSVVDMALAAGLGSVTIKGVTLAPNFITSEKMTGVKHCNGTDEWIVVRTYNTGEFIAYLLTPGGLVTTPVISQVSTSSILPQGYMRISPNGNKIAYVAKSTSTADAVIVHDFNTANGIVSTSSLVLNGINYSGQAYGLEFSPDGSKIYASCGAFTNSTNCIYQWDLCAGNDASIQSSRYKIDSSSTSKPGCALQLGPDGKIYQSRFSANSISVINFPNLPGAACGYSANLLPVPTTTFSTNMNLGLPNYSSSYFQQAHPLFEYTLHCQTAQFSAFSSTLINTCTATNQGLQNLSWDFGDPTTGTANVSSLQNPIHVFSSLGTYTVRAIFQYQCRTDTLFKIVNVIHSTPSFSVSGRLAICKGESTVLSVNTTSLSYFWFHPLPGGTSNPSIAVSPTSTTIYSVTGSFGSCSLSKATTVTVSACLGLMEEPIENLEFEVFPNPAVNEIEIIIHNSIDLKEFDQIILHDELGRILLMQDVSNSIETQKVDIHGLQEGMYMLTLQKANGTGLNKRVVIRR